jgi:hypothetical protein
LRNLKRKEKGKCKRKKEKNSVGTTSAFLPPRQPILHRPNLAIGADLGALPVMGTGRAGPPAHAKSVTRRCQVGSPARFFSSATQTQPGRCTVGPFRQVYPLPCIVTARAQNSAGTSDDSARNPLVAVYKSNAQPWISPCRPMPSTKSPSAPPGPATVASSRPIVVRPLRAAAEFLLPPLLSLARVAGKRAQRGAAILAVFSQRKRGRASMLRPDCRRGPWKSLPSTRGCITDVALNLGQGALGRHTDGARGHSGRDWGPAVPQFLAVCPTPPRSRPAPWAEALALAMEVRTHLGSSYFPISCLAPVNFVFETPGGWLALLWRGRCRAGSAPPFSSVARER